MNKKLNKIDIDFKVGKRIKTFRLNKSLTQEKLSEILDVTPTYIAMVETGKTGMSIETLIKISIALNVTPNDILQDYIPSYCQDDMSDYIYNQISSMDERNKRLMLKISEQIISESE